MAIKLRFAPGNRVCFCAEHIRRCAHDSDVVGFVGTVDELIIDGRFARVTSDSGERKTIACTNLAKVTTQYGIVDPGD